MRLPVARAPLQKASGVTHRPGFVSRAGARAALSIGWSDAPSGLCGIPSGVSPQLSLERRTLRIVGLPSTEGHTERRTLWVLRLALVALRCGAACGGVPLLVAQSFLSHPRGCAVSCRLRDAPFELCGVLGLTPRVVRTSLAQADLPLARVGAHPVGCAAFRSSRTRARVCFVAHPRGHPRPPAAFPGLASLSAGFLRSSPSTLTFHASHAPPRDWAPPKSARQLLATSRSQDGWRPASIAR